jgi:P-type E1-E2 ATPase
LQLEHLVLDVNGTLAVDGRLLDGVGQRLSALNEQMSVHLVTADTHGAQSELDRQLGLTAHRLIRGKEREQKAEFVDRLGAARVVAVGNGANDAEMLRCAALGIVVIGGEGASGAALAASDVVATNILDALDLLLHPQRLVATLRR